MKIEFKTVITHEVTIGDGGYEKVEHYVSVDAGDLGSALPENHLLRIAAAGCKAGLTSLTRAVEDGHYDVTSEVDDEEDDSDDDEE